MLNAAPEEETTALYQRIRGEAQRRAERGSERARERAGQPAGARVRREDYRMREIGQKLDALGPEYRLTQEKQGRMEELLDREKHAPLPPVERAELEALAAECDEIMLRRAEALPRIL